MRAFLLVALIACSDRRVADPPASSPAASPTELAALTADAKPTSNAGAPGWASIATVVTGKATASALAIDSKSEVVMAVSFENSVTIGTQTFDGGHGGLALVKVASDGTIVWSSLISKDRTVEYANLAIDSKDAIVLAASLKGSVDFGGGPLASAGEKDILLAKYNTEGKHVWSRRFGGPEPDRPANVVVDGKDQIIVGGYYADTVDFGGKKLTGKNDAEMFVAKYAADGKLIFANRISGGGSEKSELYDVAVDGKGNAIAIGAFGKKLDLGGTPLAGDATKPIQTYVVAYAPTGRIAWSTAYSTGTMTMMTDIAADAAGNIVLAGHDMNIPLDRNNMVSFEVQSGQPTQGSMTSVIAMLGSDHKPKWSVAVSGAGMTDGVAIALADNGILVAGDGSTAPFGDTSLSKVRTFAARVGFDGKLAWAKAIPNAAEITANPDLATRGSTAVVAAQTGARGDESLVVMRPE